MKGTVLKPFCLYPIENLPSSFRYPDELVHIAKTGSYPPIYPWWFVDADSETGRLFYEIRQSSQRNLVPFAKVDDDRDAIACFDGDNLNGNPGVFLLVSDEDWDRLQSFADFNSWLAAAVEDAAQRNA